ncbi:hypothetical protein N9166_01220 [bacterium]|nr:hypothetical protein [bacterium]
MAIVGGEIEFKAYDQDQGQLFPAYLAEVLDPSDPVFFLNDRILAHSLTLEQIRSGSMQFRLPEVAREGDRARAPNGPLGGLP